MIEQAQYPAAEGNLTVFQTIRITASIHCFMVVANYRQNLFQVIEVRKNKNRAIMI